MISPLGEVITEIIAQHPAQVQRWRENQAGAWGYLAGQGILAYKRRVGHPLSEAERRQVWAALWAALEQLRTDP